MDESREDFKEMVYNLINGFVESDLCTESRKESVANEFADGSKCDQLYEEVYEANRRVCQSLGVEEDRDVELIISNLLDIGKYLSMKMYDYGKYFSKNEGDL